jgi:hypothetical protein
MVHIQTHKGEWAVRKRLTALLASVTLSLIGILTAFPAPADAATSHEWASYKTAVSSLYTYNSSAATWAFNQPTSYITNGSCNNTGDCNTSYTNPAGLVSTPVDRFASYADFRADVGTIDKSVFSYVMYDNEKWTYTPVPEQQHPAKYMALFASLAHSHGFGVIFEPARDLASVDTDCPNTYSNYDQWYVNCKIAQAAGQDSTSGDQLWVQNQADSTTQSEYDYLFDNAVNQYRGAFPAGVTLAELSSSYGSVSQDYADAQSVLGYSDPASGEYFTSGSASWFSGVLTDLKNGGY